MNSQFQLFHGGTFQMRSGEALRIGAVDGELAVVRGSIWLTRTADAQDHVLRAGQRLALAATDGAVVEPGQRDQSAVIGWQPAVPAEPQAPRFKGLARRAAAPSAPGRPR